MERKQFEKNWAMLKDSIHQRWNRLTQEDIFAIDGMFDHFIGCLVKRYGYNREMAEKEVQNWHPEQERMMAQKSHKEHKAEIHQWKASEHTSHPTEQQAKHKKRKAG